MKNKGTIIVIGVIVVALLSILLITKDSKQTSKKTTESVVSEEPESILENAQNESAAVKDDEKAELEQINVSTYLDFYKSEDKSLVLVARPTCGYCQIAEPIIQNLAFKNNIKIYYLNTDDFSDDDSSNFIQSDEFFSEGYGTPVLLVVGNNSIIDKVDGLTDSHHYTEFFKSNGYIE